MTTSTLLDLYRATSKHSQYQRLPARLRELLPADALEIHSRHEQQRLAYLADRIDFDGLTVADIGGNTGFFSFELLERGAASVDHIEGNAAHSAFVNEAARRLDLVGRLRSRPIYLDFGAPALAVYDVVLLLNVLHHVGDDYGNPATARDQVQASIAASLRVMANHGRRLVLQLGFNWQGRRDQPIYSTGTRAEMIATIEALADDWQIEAIGIATRGADGIIYQDASAANIARDDSLGEFLNRPLFILRSRRLGGRDNAATRTIAPA